MAKGFDWLTRALISIDAIKKHLRSSNKHHIDDYYSVVSAIDNLTLKMNDGSMISFFKLKGYGAILSEQEKLQCAKSIEDKLKNFFSRPGFQIQIVDISDPELTRRRVKRSMQDSIDELNNIGLGANIFTTDYMEHIISKSVWKDQYLVVKTSPEANPKINLEKKESEQERNIRRDKERFIKELLEKEPREQGVFLTPDEKITLIEHVSFRESVESAFARAGSIINAVNCKKALIAQREAIYGEKSVEKFSPNTTSMNVVSSNQRIDTAHAVLKEPDLAAQILMSGATEEGLPSDVILMAGRYYKTQSMIMGQPGFVGADGESMQIAKSYAHLISVIPTTTPYISSFSMESEPFDSFDYKVEKVYAGLSAILPFTDNLQIQGARKEIERRHKENIDLSVYFTVSITTSGKTLDELYKNSAIIDNAIAEWGGAAFRAAELDKVQALMSSAPGATSSPKLTRVLESLSYALFQSPVFMDGISYDSGFLHFFTDLNMPFPVEEQSSKNINYNSYTCGDSGTGKSTLLTLFNLALLAKPKANQALKGEIPLIFNIDFGKTSFGLTRLIQKLAPENKKKYFLCHEMSTNINSSYNIHDLPIGRETPTTRQKNAIVRFLSVLLLGIDGNSEKGFKIKYSEVSNMISLMVSEVYKMLSNGNSPRMFDDAEFKHKATLDAIQQAGIDLRKEISYYSIANKLMEHNASKNAMHAIIVRRYAMPRLSDYNQLFALKSETFSRYKSAMVPELGTSYIDFLRRRITEVTSEYPCFNNETRINVDIARLISIDIKNVCGDNEHRKAVFGAMCLLMYLTKKENAEESVDLFDNVQEIYQPYLKRLSNINQYLPGVLNIEEAHVLMHLFEDVLNDAQRQNRKANWGLKTFSQRLSDPSDVFFSLCSSVFITSNQSSEAFEPRFKEMGLSSAEKHIVRHELSKSLTTFFAYIKVNTKRDGDFNRIAIRLKAFVTSGLIWASNSNQTDINFFDEVIKQVGFDEAIYRLQEYFPEGQVRKYFEESHIKEAAKDLGYTSVFEFFIAQIVKSPKPDTKFNRILKGT